MVKKRRLSARQQKLAEDSLRFVKPCVNQFRQKNPDLWPAMRRVDMESVATLAVVLAAFTFKPDRSRATTYFGSSIRHALYREVLKQQRLDGRYIPTEKILDPQPNSHRTRQEMRAMRALRMLGIKDRQLLEDRLVEQVTLEQLSVEQRCDPRTVSKRVKKVIERLRQIEDDMP